MNFNQVSTDDRAYNMILTDRAFDNQTHCYVLLGLENNGIWNLLGGKKDKNDKTHGVTAARALYEESAQLLNKVDDVNYWSHLSSYEWGKHKVFIHDPKNLDINISKLNDAVKKVLVDKNLPDSYKEISRYQLIRLTDLFRLTNGRGQSTKEEAGLHYHPKEPQPMKIDGWLLDTLKNANVKDLVPYLY